MVLAQRWYRCAACSLWHGHARGCEVELFKGSANELIKMLEGTDRRPRANDDRSVIMSDPPVVVAVRATRAEEEGRLAEAAWRLL